MHTVLHLVRHGSSIWNESKRLQGWKDIELSEKGISQARELADKLKNYPLRAVYTSTLKRAVQTGEAIARHHMLPVVQIEDFKEAGFGILEGLTWEEAGKHPLLPKDLHKNRYTAKVPGGESVEEVEKRASKALNSIVSKHSGEHIVVVSHGLVLKSLAIYMGFTDPSHIEEFYIENASIMTVEFSHKTKSYNIIDLPVRWYPNPTS